LGLSSRKIAQEEGINYNAVDKSIKAAIKNFKKYYENPLILGVHFDPLCPNE